MKNMQHENLCMLARLKSDRALGALAREFSVRAGLIEQMQALGVSVRDARSYAANDISFGSNVANVEVFCASRMKQLKIQLNKCDAKISELKAHAANEFGRVIVLEKLLKT